MYSNVNIYHLRLRELLQSLEISLYQTSKRQHEVPLIDVTRPRAGDHGLGIGIATVWFKVMRLSES